MILYPTSENRTVLTFQSLFTWGLMVLSLIGYLAIYLPAKWRHTHLVQQNRETVRQELSKQHANGAIAEVFYIRAHEDLSVIGDPAYRENFPPSVSQAYDRLTQIPAPIETWLQRDNSFQIIYALIPHHWVLLLLGFICLPALGFIFEHLYDRLIYAGLFCLLAPLWVVLGPHLKSNFWPSPIFSWAMTMATLLAVFYVTAPRSIVTLSLRTWLFKNLESKIEVPTLMFPAIFFLGLTLVNMYIPLFKDYFQPEQLATAALTGGFVGLIVQFLPNRDQLFDANPEVRINQQLARAEVYFNEQQKDQAMGILKELLEMSPNLKQTRRIADLAWEHHQTELAERAFKSVLRQTLDQQHLSQAFQIAEIMIFHNITVPDSVMLKIFDYGLKEGKVDQIRKMLPYLQDRPNVSIEDVAKVQERLVTAIFEKELPDRETLYNIKLWFESHWPQSGAVAKIDHFLSQHSSEAGLVSNYAPTMNVHKHLQVSLLSITSNHVQIQTPDQTKKTIPWTAVLACFGSRVKDGPDMLGTIFVQFKRKIFACCFSNRDVMVEDSQQSLLSFPKAWGELKRHSGQQIRFLDMPLFGEVENEQAFQVAAENYLHDRFT